MENIIEKYREKYRIFEELLDREEVFKDGTADFEGLCRAIGADPVILDTYIGMETGYGGQEIISAFRSRWIEKLKRNCGPGKEL